MKDCQIDCWVDSGTLLGLMRDGELIDHDRDIDIGIWNGQSQRLQAALDMVRKSGYHVRALFFDGSLFGLKLTPISSGHLRDVDINIFSRAGDYAWCPQPIIRGDLTKRGVLAMARSAWKKPLEALKFGADAVLLYYWTRCASHVEIDRHPWNRICSIRTWWIPLRFFDTIEYDDRRNLPIPARWEDYLTLRYGKWKIPNEDWSYARDDGGLAGASPSVLIQHLSRDLPSI